MSSSDSNHRLTYREKRERKAERLFEWAEKRESAAVSAHELAHELADMIPLVNRSSWAIIRNAATGRISSGSTRPCG